MIVVSSTSVGIPTDLGLFIIDEGYVIHSCNKVSSLQIGFD